MLANTFGLGGGTAWTSARSRSWRIDYICIPRCRFSTMAYCSVDHTIAFALNHTDHHNLVRAKA